MKQSILVRSFRDNMIINRQIILNEYGIKKGTGITIQEVEDITENLIVVHWYLTKDTWRSGSGAKTYGTIVNDKFKIINKDKKEKEQYYNEYRKKSNEISILKNELKELEENYEKKQLLLLDNKAKMLK